MTMKEPVYIIDGSGYIFRAYYAIRPLTSKRGVPTNAVYGFMTLLQKLLKEHRPKYLAIAFDPGGKNFRHELYADYKANRPPVPPDLVPQFALIQRLVDAFAIKQYRKPGFEADDLIGTLTKRSLEAGHPVVIVTGDKDMMQLVDDRVCLLDELRALRTGSEQFIRAPQVIEKFGVPPHQVIDVLALAGDASDHVPGVRGIGEKTAAELVREHGRLESILNYAPLMTQKSRREKLMRDSDMARLSKQLVTIDCAVDLDFCLEDMQSRDPHWEVLENLFEELDFKKSARSVQKQEPEMKLDASRLGVFEGVRSSESSENLGLVAYDAKRSLKCGQISGDPMIASYLLNPDAKHELDALFENHLGRIPDSAQEKAIGVLKLTQILEAQLQQEGLWELYDTLEIPLENLLAKIEANGIKLDFHLLQEMSQQFGARLRNLEDEAHRLAGLSFNLGSPKQVADVLFNRLQYQSLRKTKTSQSTDADVLEELAQQYPLPKLLLEHRMLSKLKGTYIDALPRLADPTTGRIHTVFNQAVAATGRLSSSDPNLQNIPIRTQEGKRIREAFIASPGFRLASLDYSQIELRVLAHVTEDPVLLESFAQDQDVHVRTASEIFDLKLEHVSSEQRRIAKTINFGLLYGMGAYKLSETLNLSRADATIYLKKYQERYSGIYLWHHKLLEQAKREGLVKTLLGRRRFVQDLNSENRMLAARAERIAINTPIQGSAADIVKKAMLDVDRYLEAKFPQVKILLQVHDELVLEVPEPIAQEVVFEVAKIMEGAVQLKVPMKVQSGIATNWAAAHS
ncbi:MAG: DNA polymerase I [Myxococcaceae bacterium]|nr:DNA polymerase I [Myxococcaceae bacterium]MBH2006244.1 DNA polymerase I [Myxococcaceae bacterium]